MIKHPSSVTNLRQLEDHLLMVGGLENSVPSLLCMANFSLRCMIFVISRKRLMPLQLLPSSNIQDILIQFPSISDLMSLQMGRSWLWVIPLFHIIVEASAGEDRYVRLWSVNTGQRIHARISENTFDDFVVGLQFSRRHQQDNGL